MPPRKRAPPKPPAAEPATPVQNMLVESITAFIDEPEDATFTDGKGKEMSETPSVYNDDLLQQSLDNGKEYDPINVESFQPIPGTATSDKSMHEGLEEIDLGFDFTNEFAKAKSSAAATTDKSSIDDVIEEDVRKPISRTDKKILRFGYLTALVAADSFTKNKVPGREMAQQFCLDKELSKTLDEILEEVGDQMNITKHMTPVVKLGALTAGVWVQIQASKQELAGSNDSVPSDDLSTTN